MSMAPQMNPAAALGTRADNPMQLPRSFEVFQRVPESDNPSSMPREDRRNLEQVAKWLRDDQWEMAVSYRIRVARGWIAVRSIMEGYHYFYIDNFGVWVPLGKRRGEIRAFTNLMRSRYNRELGRLVDNNITCNAIPRSALSGGAMYKAESAKVMTNAWLEEINMPMIWDEFCQHHLIYGMSALYRYVDHFNQQVVLEAVAGPELYPIPYYENSDQKLNGMFRAKMVTRQWIQDNVPEAENKVGNSSVSLGDKSMFLTSDVGMWNSTQDGALAIWFWMKRSRHLPNGLMGLIIEDEIFRYTTNNGIIPFEISRYQQQSSRWYGIGLCETQVAPQMEHNRQYSDIIKSASFNKGRLFVNRGMFDVNELRDSDQTVITMQEDAYIGEKDPYYFLPPQRTGPDVGAVMALSEQDSRRAAGHESDIIMGQQEGRTESGPATERLNTNASSPLIPCTRRMANALKRTFPACLDMLRTTWPDDKQISTVGQENLPDEIHLKQRDTWPTSQDVIMMPGPILPMGRSEMLNLLYAMKQMPGDDGQGPEISSAEFRRALRMANYIPDGLETLDVEEQRIQQRLKMLFNDGQQPGFDPNDRQLHRLLMFENHRKAVELIRKKILSPAFTDPKTTSRVVQNAFIDLLNFHMAAMEGDKLSSGGLGLDAEEADGRGMAQTLDIAEQDMFSTDGKMTENGLMMGV